MKNYISVNAKHYKKKEIVRISTHNFRLQKINYLLQKEDIHFANKDIIYANNITSPGENKLTKLGHYTKDLNNTFNKVQLDNILQTQYNLLISHKEAIQRKNRSYAKTNESPLVELVVALSEEQALAYLKEGKDLMHGLDNLTKKLCDKYGFTPLQVSLHLDEGHLENGVVKNNIHAHITLFNFDFEKERSVLRNFRTQDYKGLQDLAKEAFQEKGLNFIRGVSKEITKLEHLERNDFVLHKQTLAISENELKLSDLIKSKKNEYDAINALKKEHEALLNNFSKGSSEYDTLYKTIGVLKKEEKALRDSWRDLKQQKKDLVAKDTIEAKKHTSDLTHAIVNKHTSKNLLGTEFIANITELKKDVFKEINKALDTNLKIAGFEEKEKTIKELQNKVATQAKAIAIKDERIESITKQAQTLEKAFKVNYKQLTNLKQNINNIVKNRIRRSALLTKLKSSKIITRLRNKFKNTSNSLRM